MDGLGQRAQVPDEDTHGAVARRSFLGLVARGSVLPVTRGAQQEPVTPSAALTPRHRCVTHGHLLSVRGLLAEQPNPMHSLPTARDLERPQRAGDPLEHQVTGLLHSPEHLRKQFSK